jgi:hypothetical protein
VHCRIRPMLQNMAQQPTTLPESQHRHPRTSSLSALKIDTNVLIYFFCIYSAVSKVADDSLCDIFTPWLKKMALICFTHEFVSVIHGVMLRKIPPFTRYSISDSSFLLLPFQVHVRPLCKLRSFYCNFNYSMLPY